MLDIVGMLFFGFDICEYRDYLYVVLGFYLFGFCIDISLLNIVKLLIIYKF